MNKNNLIIISSIGRIINGMTKDTINLITIEATIKMRISPLRIRINYLMPMIKVILIPLRTILLTH